MGFLISSVYSLYYLYRAIRPRLANKVFSSKIYFRDLAKQAEEDRKKIKQALLMEDESDFIDDMANQLLSLAKVCNEKYEFLFIAERFMVVSFLVGLSIYVLNLFSCLS